jgi:hypothetical protein
MMPQVGKRSAQIPNIDTLPATMGIASITQQAYAKGLLIILWHEGSLGSKVVKKTLFLSNSSGETIRG